MAEYIDKAKFEELMCKKVRSNFDLYYVDKSEHYHTKAIGYSIAADEVRVFPAADVQPIRHGHWIYVESYRDCEGDFYSKYKCSCCDFALGGVYDNSDLTNFCGGCGADMRKEK